METTLWTLKLSRSEYGSYKSLFNNTYNNLIHFLNVSTCSWSFYSYEDKLCGLCGDYNGDSKDDFQTPTGELVQSPNDFGHSWNTDPK